MSEIVILNLSSILMIIISIFVIFAFLFFLIYLLKQNALKTEEEEKLIKSHVYDKSIELIDSSRRKSFEIIKESQSQIDKILQDASFLSDDTRLYLKKKIEEVSALQRTKFMQQSKDFFTEYTDAIRSQKEEGIESIKEMTQSIKSEALRELDSFKNELYVQTEDSKSSLATKSAEDYATLHTQMLQKLNQERSEIVKKMSEYVLGSALDINQHEQLIAEALERAIKQNEF